jgi:hypothetical protein
MNDVDNSIRSQYGFDSDVQKVFADTMLGKKVLVGLVKSGDGYKVKQVVDNNGDDVWGQAAFSQYKTVDKFLETNPSRYQNPIKIVQGEPAIKYFSRAPYEGLPSQVPFNQKEGWYVTTDYILSGFGKPYEDSGRVVNFWICNVGENGLIEGKERDDCRYYNLGSSADLDFPGLSKSKSATLVSDAQKALSEAARNYGDKRVRINDNVYDTGITEGGEGGRCSDFMSPSDCNLMFNVCDPVICPESRCDFGGAYRVSNVVQSGIIGSLLLCLPNANEGIVVPVCLSGVHAGLEGYISILNSTEACLQESLDTGKNIGICDEVKSVYMCEFFWKQAIPLMDVAIPRLFESILGQGTRGGGEYATVNHAWENMQGSIDYFKNEYAVNSVKAFNQRSTEGIGSEVCKVFVSARYPNSKDFLDNLVEPDVPVQFTGWFSENILNDATTPPTSHYKVYYHIYAGKDIGANYVVYLKNPPQASYVNTMYSYVVDRGFIGKGDQVDRTRDFTSVAGYQELCININGQEECGFKQVSTSWALDELSNRYVEEQSKQTDISSAEECVAGSPSLWSFAQPNLQAGMQEGISPELYKRGIIRVCSKGNPGANVEADVESVSGYDRWKNVGYCDNKEIGCWVDTESIKDVLRDAPNLTDQVLDDIDLSYLGEVEFMTPKQSNDIIADAEKLEKGIRTWPDSDLNKAGIENKIENVIKRLIKVSERGYINSVKAESLFKIGKIYHKITERVYRNIKGEVKTTQEVVDETELEEYKKEFDQKDIDDWFIGTKVEDSQGDIWEKIEDDLWRSESGVGDYKLSDIPYPPLELISLGTVIVKQLNAEIEEIDRWIKKDIWLGKNFFGLGGDEFYSRVVVKNLGEENKFDIVLYNSNKDDPNKEKVDSTLINLEKGESKSVTLKTSGFLNFKSIETMGEKYSIVLYDSSDPTDLIEIVSVEKYLSEDVREHLYR